MKFSILVYGILLTAAFFSSCQKDIIDHSPTVQEYLNYRLDGIDYHFDPVDDTITVAGYLPDQNNPATMMYICCARWNLTPPGGLILTCLAPTPAAGTYPSAQPCVVWNGVRGITIPQNVLQVTLTSFATNLGGYFEGNFTGNFMDQGTSHTLTGSFYVKRNN